MSRAAGQRGSGSVLAIAVCGAVVGMTVAMTAACGSLVVHQRVMNAADAAALAAADIASGAVPGEPCVSAGRAADANDATVLACTIDDGGVVTITAGAMWAGIPVSARSRAGPPPEG